MAVMLKNCEIMYGERYKGYVVLRKWWYTRVDD